MKYKELLKIPLSVLSKSWKSVKLLRMNICDKFIIGFKKSFFLVWNLGFAFFYADPRLRKVFFLKKTIKYSG